MNKNLKHLIPALAIGSVIAGSVIFAFYHRDPVCRYWHDLNTNNLKEQIRRDEWFEKHSWRVDVDAHHRDFESNLQSLIVGVCKHCGRATFTETETITSTNLNSVAFQAGLRQGRVQGWAVGYDDAKKEPPQRFVDAVRQFEANGNRGPSGKQEASVDELIRSLTEAREQVLKEEAQKAK